MWGRKGTGEERNRELTLIFSATVSEQCLLRGKRVPQPPPTPPPPSPPFTAEAGRALSRRQLGRGAREGAPAAAAARLCTGGRDNARGPLRALRPAGTAHTNAAKRGGATGTSYLLPLYIAKGRGAPLGVPEEVFLQRNKHSARPLAGWRQPPARQGAAQAGKI